MSIESSNDVDIDLSEVGIYDEEVVYNQWVSEYWGEPDTIPTYDFYVEYYIDGYLNISSDFVFNFISSFSNIAKIIIGNVNKNNIVIMAV